MFTRTLIFWLILLGATTAAAQTGAELRALVDQSLHLYSIVEDRRDPGETVVIKNNTLHLRYRQDLRKLPMEKRNQFVCDATRWMLAGRRDTSTGLKALLATTPSVKSVKLVAYAVDTNVSLNRKGRYDQKRKLIPQLVLTINRERVSQIDPKKAAENLRGKSCLQVARTLLNQFKMSNF